MHVCGVVLSSDFFTIEPSVQVFQCLTLPAVAVAATAVAVSPRQPPPADCTPTQVNANWPKEWVPISHKLLLLLFSSPSFSPREDSDRVDMQHCRV